MANSHWVTALAAILAAEAAAQWTYPSCSPATNADFAVTTVVSRAANDASILEPLKMDFAMAADGTVDIYYIQRGGQLKRYDGKAKTVSTVGTVPVVTQNEDGLVGLALDPAFATNRRVFVYYSHSSGFRVSRFTLDGTGGQLNTASEKVLLTIPSGRGKWHTSGAMRFDAYGDLWVSVGDNETTYMGPANTKDLRGSLLRIHPEEDGTYSIPKGNMWESVSAWFRANGKPDVADKYLDSTRMRREIYVKGTRNAYTLTLDPVRRWAVYGDCGPDQESSTTTNKALWTEEHNVVTEPGYMGWPFWTAAQKLQAVYPYNDADGKAAWSGINSMNTAAPVNTYQGVGIPELPPAKPATYSYAHSCAMTGPIFRYDGRLPNANQLPPHFNRIWFTTDFNRGRIHAIRLDDAGKMVGDAVEVFNGLSQNFNKPIDFQQGPDGALYYLNYSCGTWRVADACTGIYRIDYKGACKDPNLTPEPPVIVRNEWKQSTRHGLVLDRKARALAVSGAGYHRLEVYSVSGALVHSAQGMGSKSYPLGSILEGRPAGVYRARLVTEDGMVALSLPHFGL